jgi:hypothetical protein
VLPVVLTSVFAGVSTQNCHICTPSHEIQVGHSPFSLVASDTAFEDLRTKADDLRPANRLSGAEEGPKTAFLCWIYVEPKKKKQNTFQRTLDYQSESPPVAHASILMVPYPGSEWSKHSQVFQVLVEWKEEAN